jgi:BirA family biotin operon repressor/biotin-[acetyl-CoA-carboxylase] ligase
MIILTDNVAFARRCVPHSGGWQEQQVSAFSPGLSVVAAELFDTETIMVSETAGGRYWDYLIAVDCARHSQYDALSRLAVSAHQPPDRTLCCAGYGEEFHGFKNRHWQACEGNIHVSAFLRPAMEVSGGAAGFIIATVIAGLQTVRSFDLQGAHAAIKWVNDILVGGAKVGGVLARLQKQGPVTESAVVGIGLNVEQSPPLERDAFVPVVASVSDFVKQAETCRHADAFPRLMDYLGKNLEDLRSGQFTQLLDRYRQHSLVLGREVSVYKDTRNDSAGLIARGLVEAVGQSLELSIAGYPEPVTNGRLVMGDG